MFLRLLRGTPEGRLACLSTVLMEEWSLSDVIPFPDDADQSLPRWRDRTRQPRYWVTIAPVALIEAVLLLILWDGYARGWAWVGISSKTLWDWLQVILVPLTLTSVGIWFTKREKARDDDQRRTDRDREERYRENEGKLAENRLREATLEAYLDRMSELLLDKNLSHSKPDDEVREVARARTMTAFPRVGKGGQAVILQFLYDAKLLGTFDFWKDVTTTVVVSLANANLNGIKLRQARLSGAFLFRVKMIHADLTGSDMERINLEGADLRGAVLKQVQLNDGLLRSADLRLADFTGANLTGANLSNSNLQGAILQGTCLRQTTLRGSNLQRAKMTGSELQDADFERANLRYAKVTAEQLAQAKSLTGTTMPDGTIHL